MTGPTPPPPRDFEDLRALLLSERGITVSRDDPILMAYTIHRVALDETSQMLATVKTALAEAVAAQSATYAKALQEGLDELKSDSTRQRLMAMQEAAIQADRTVATLRRTVRWLAFICSLTVVAALTVLGILAATLS